MGNQNISNYLEIMQHTSKLSINQRKLETRKYLELDGYKNMAHQNLWATAKELLKRKYIVLNAYTGKEERLKFNYISIHFEKFINIQQ